MWFMYILSWAALLIQVVIVTLSIAAGLYYLAELVEEFTTITAKIIRYTIFAIIAVYVCLIVFEEFPWYMVACGISSLVTNYLVLQTFPYFVLNSPSFIGSVVLLLINHYLAFSYFAEYWHPFSEVLAYFTVCLWLVPFALFISLSANENVLPTISESRQFNQDDGDTDIVSSYFKRKGKKYGLLSFLKYTQDSMLPQRVKKAF